MDKLEEFKDFLIENERSQNTINAYLTSIKLFLKRYDGEINKTNMINFKQYQLENRMPKTAYNRCVAMNQYCLFLGHEDFCVKTIKIQTKNTLENVISVYEYQLLIDGLLVDGNIRGYFMVKFLAKTGARVSEFVKMRRESLKYGYEDMWTKGKVRRIRIPISLIQESAEYFKNIETETLFTNKYNNPLSTRGVASLIKHWAIKYGIRPEVAYPHSLRHLFAKQFLKTNSNLPLLADLMGHSSVNTTAIYLKLSEAEQMEQLELASGW